jgi:hypothetical protein
MKNINEILEYLEKDKLTPDEETQLNNFTKDDSEAKEFVDTYRKIKIAAKEITVNDLSDYILHKNGLEPENPGFHKKIPAIEAKLRSDKEFEEEFKLLNEEYNEVDSFLTASVDNSDAGKMAAPARHAKNNYAVYAFASVLIIGIVYALLLIVSNLTTPEYYQYASLDDKTEFYVTRGRMTDDFQNSLKALEERDYEKAIVHLNSDIANNPGDETIFYTHYILGLSYLETAEKSFLGLFTSYDNERAAAALDNFLISIEKNKSGRFHNVNLDAYFYAAKASLMLDLKEDAINYLYKVVEEKGSKSAEAEIIINELL